MMIKMNGLMLKRKNKEELQLKKKIIKLINNINHKYI